LHTTQPTQVLNPYDRVIWSADVEDEVALMVVLETLIGLLRIVKIDRLFLEGRDLSILSKLREMGFLVFDDAKIAEIPVKLVGIARKHLVHRPWMLNCMAGNTSTGFAVHGDPDLVDGLKRFADACHETGTRPCGVTVLTSKSVELVAREYNERTPVEQVLFYVELLMECGFTDVVCSAQEAAAIRAESCFNGLDLNTPSIRLPDGPVHDQARVMTPERAVAAGATRLVIGRPITNGVPADNLRTIVARLQ